LQDSDEALRSDGHFKYVTIHNVANCVYITLKQTG